LLGGRRHWGRGGLWGLDGEVCGGGRRVVVGDGWGARWVWVWRQSGDG